MMGEETGQRRNIVGSLLWICDLDVEKCMSIFSANQFESNVLLIRFQKVRPHKIAKNCLLGLW